jgi:hypothetical protein
VSAWKPYTLDAVMRWCDQIEVLPFATGSSIGLSTEGRLLRQLTITETTAPRFIVVLGGQHPPEASGTRALTQFIAEICNDEELSRSFRKQFQTIVIPMINPDGKHHGHWRGTLGGKDSNRDWIEQTLPEIQAVTSFLSRTTTGKDRRCWFAIDFHATNRDFFYVKASNSPTDPESFTHRWFEGVAKEEGRFKVDYEVTDDASAASGTSSKWMAEVLKCPAYTREFRYPQDEESIRAKARDEARAIMRLLLSQSAEKAP